MTRLELVEERVKRIRHILTLLRKTTPDASGTLERDEDLLHLVSFRI